MNKTLNQNIKKTVATGNDIEIIKFARSLEGYEEIAIKQLALAVVEKGKAGNIYRFAIEVENAPITLLAKGLCKTCNFVYMQLFAKDVLGITLDEFIDIYYDEPENEEDSYIC